MGQDFCFYCLFQTNSSEHNQFLGGHNNLGGTLIDDRWVLGTTYLALIDGCKEMVHASIHCDSRRVAKGTSKRRAPLQIEREYEKRE